MITTLILILILLLSEIHEFYHFMWDPLLKYVGNNKKKKMYVSNHF